MKRKDFKQVFKGASPLGNGVFVLYLTFWFYNFSIILLK